MNRLSLGNNLSIGTFLIMCRLPSSYLKSLNEFISIFHLLEIQAHEHPSSKSNMSHMHKLSRAGFLVCLCVNVFVRFFKV